jgi:hypothetical protein
MPIERIGSILHTSDGGDNWETQLEIKSGMLYSTYFMAIEFLNDTIGWALGGEFDNWDYVDETYLYYTSDGGNNWEEIGLVDTRQKYELNIVNESIIWCGSPDLVVSNDGGDTWTSFKLDIGGISVASLVNGEYGWIYSHNIFPTPYNKIFFTNALGRPWVEDKSLPGSIRILKMTNISGEYLWAVGTNGRIYHRQGIPTSVENDYLLTEGFELKQNYPNPFNPSTIIKYSIPQKSNITLKVFDLSGSEVTVLVNEVQGQGNYEIEFSTKGGSGSAGDGFRLTSGIYFYRLQADGFVETKKMILIK